jgi:hypothetical protein
LSSDSCVVSRFLIYRPIRRATRLAPSSRPLRLLAVSSSRPVSSPRPSPTRLSKICRFLWYVFSSALLVFPPFRPTSYPPPNGTALISLPHSPSSNCASSINSSVTDVHPG